MIIDTSAIIAIVGREPGHESLERHMITAATLKIGAPTQLEAGMVLVGRWGARGHTFLARFLQHNHVETVSFTETHTEVALDAFQRFGKGRHPAGLNFGDCLTYAVASVANEPLLFVGKDFSLTDLKLVE
ncbi:MAG: type II toxin-antitoxin system VapC family toxin [Kutzneria sp.]|nr:type II toxin-antitoxin system VapC family toxin [Kutzneria sp.]